MKPWYKSKTIWVNGLALTLGVIGTQASVFGDHADIALLVVGIANIWLRIITDQPISSG